MNDLTEKQKKFCLEYLVDLNGKQAAIRSGYSVKTADVIAAENLVKPNVQAYLSELQTELRLKTQISIEKVLNEYAKLAFYNINQILKFNNNKVTLKGSDELDESITAAIQEIRITPTKNGNVINLKMADKKSALDSICKVLGYESPKKLDVTSDGKPLEKGVNMSVLTIEELNVLALIEQKLTTNGNNLEINS